MKNRLLLLFVFFTQILLSQEHWESLVLANQTFRYFVSGGEPAANWYTKAFDDSTWKEGKGGFGYGDNDDGTIISATTSVYLRKTFNVIDNSKIQALLLDMDYDDGYVAYLNGNEIARSINVSGQFPTYNATLSADREAGVPERVSLNPNILTNGVNLIAVHVINNNSSSSDLSSNVYMHVQLNSSGITYNATPTYFKPPFNLTSSNLPIIKVNTNGGVISDDPKIMARMQVVMNTDGSDNNINGPYNAYDGWVGIEYRGESTQQDVKLKKSYRFETRTAAGANLNVALMGMPEENDWILYGPIYDKSLLRNEIAFHICDVMEQYASRRQYCELVVNDDYQGIYVLEEKIKIDDNRVNIAKLKPEDTSGDELTGGYIFRSDKSEAASPYFYSGVSYYGTQANMLQYFDPEYSELQTVQRNYLKNYVTDFEKNLVTTGFSNLVTGYNKFINVSSFVDYLIAAEMILEVDRFRFSTYLYKEKDSNGGKIFAGPMWDNNLGFGEADYYTYILNDNVWSYLDTSGRMFWWRRLMEDSYFKNLFFTRWVELRETKLTDESLLARIDSMANYINQAQIRNFTKWPVLGVYLWSNRFVGQTYSEEINYLKSYVVKRNAWIDKNITGQLIKPEIELSIPFNYHLKDTFEIGIHLKNDYFNRIVFNNKHIKLNNEGDFIKKDTILHVDENDIKIKLINLNPGVLINQNFNLTLSNKIINTFNDLTSLELSSYAGLTDLEDPKLKAYYVDNKIHITCTQPELLGDKIEIFSITGIKIAEEMLNKTYKNEIDFKIENQLIILRTTINNKSVSIKLGT